MRVATPTRLLEAVPGSTTDVVLDVVNTGEVIDGITASVIGIAPEHVRTEPALLPLFPASSGRLTVSVHVPPAHPAGRHPLTVELVSHGARVPAQYLDLDLQVAARPALAVTATPRVIRARRGARFTLELANDGNVALDVALRAEDADRSTIATFSPARVRVPAGTVVPVLLHVRGPRLFTGAEIDRPVQVSATAVRADGPGTAWAAGPDAPEDAETIVGPLADPALPPREIGVRLRQRPLISRGLLTALVLAGIVALWAGIFLLGLTKVFANDPMTKAAPASFFLPDTSANGSGGAQQVAGGAGAGGAPADTLPKSGQLPAGIGGEISGTVTATSDQQPVGRILVQAYRRTRSGLAKVSSAATQSDGTYTLAGLFPTSYYLQFSGAGFHPVWYPRSPSRAGAQPVDAVAQGSTTGVDAVVTGKPASISGAVDPGDTVHAVTTRVTARPLDVTTGAAGRPTSVDTGANGHYTITGLAAPASYQITFTTPGYQASTIVDTVTGGDARLEPTVTLGAGQGSISGRVVSGTRTSDPPLGGATVSTTVNGKTLSVLTPTTGAVGAFVLPNLPTPATYVLSYSAPGHGNWTEVVALSAGQSYPNALGTLTAGSGSISGQVVGASGAGLGGVTVTVGGAAASAGAAAPSTTTLTSPPVGRFFLNGLSDGRYTLTFTSPGYAPASVTVAVDSGSAAPSVQVRLSKQLGEISGLVTAGGTAYPGATVSATDGVHTYTATSSAAGGELAPGGYLIADLPPGSYAVTATAAGHAQQTRLVHVGAGQTVSGQNLQLGS